VLGSAALPAILRDPSFSTARNQEERKIIYQRRAHHNIRHREHHQATENRDEHHGTLEHHHDVEGLMWNKVALPLPRNELDGVGKFDGRRRAQGCADGVGTYFGRGFRLCGDVDTELQALRSTGGEEREKAEIVPCQRHGRGIQRRECTSPL
jgi:hypothetical protein